MPGSHNVDQLFNDIAELGNGFGFRLQVEGKSLGQDCARIAADSIIARSIDEQRGADASWDALEDKYRKWKVKKYGVALIGVRTGQMLSLKSMLGGLKISDELVEILYGTGQVPTESASRHFDPETDGQTTDFEKALWFSGRRPFFELSDEDSDKVFARIERALELYLSGK
jgi:hypothetical protein